ncbi:MAG: DUF6531 domain-containing protein, partial [Thermoleophilia bacterium]
MPISPDPAYSQQTPAIDGSYVVWQGNINYNGNPKNRIYFKDMDAPESPSYVLSPTAFINDYQGNPVISGNLVVWLEGGTVKTIHYTYIENGCPATQSCINNTLPISAAARPNQLAVSGTRIVWEDNRNGAQKRENDIYMYDLATGVEAPVAVEPGNQTGPDIDGDWVVWSYSDDYASYSSPNITEAYAKNLATQEIVQITANGTGPVISGTTVAFRETVQGEAGHYYMDLGNPGAGASIITSETGYLKDIDGNMVLFEKPPGGGANNILMLADLETGNVQEVTAGIGNIYHPAVSGKRLVWTDDRINPRNIYTTTLTVRLGSLMGTDTCCGSALDPVNTATGAFFYSQTDVDIQTKGLPLSIERTYNSNDQQDGPFGYGWSFNWQMDIMVESSGNAVVRRGDGRRDTFIRNGDGTFTAPSGRHDILTRNPDSTYTLTTYKQEIYAFNADNRLAAVTTEAGQTTTLTYESGQLTTITGPAGRELRLSYNAEGHIESVAYDNGPDMYSLSYGYSPDGNLTSVTDQNGGLTTYAHDSEHQITVITDPNGNASSGSPFVSNTYVDGRVTEQRDAENNLSTIDYSVPGQTAITRVIDPGDPSKDQVTIHYHDAAYRQVTETDPYGNNTVFEYDAAGNRYKLTDRLGIVTRQIFDAYGNVTDVYKAEGLPEEQHTQMTYNSRNKPLTVTDARGNTTTYSYDATDAYLLQIGYPQVTDYNGAASSYSESFTYNADGLVETSTDRNGDVTTFTYDQFGYPDVVTRNSNRLTAEQVVIDYDYDEIGRQTAVTDGNGNRTDFTYNAIDDLLSVTSQVTDPGTGQPVDVATSYTYDANGNRTSMTDPENKTTTYEYTPMDKLERTTDALGNTVEHTYDAAQNRTGTKDRNNKWTYFAYDLNNRLISATDPENKVTTYGYDAEGNQVSMTDPLLQTTTTAYDALGRATAVTEPDEGGAQRTTVYAYDSADNILSVIDPALSTTTFVYDELNRLKQTTDPTTYSSFTAYDGMGNTVKSKDPKNNETLFAYSPNDALTSVTDPLQGVTAYAYDRNGNMTNQTDANGHTTLYSYDELDRITSEKVDDGSGGYLVARSYEYDKAGNVIKDTTGEGTITYVYDDVYNLTGVTDRQGGTYSYSYDANQNQLSATDGQTNKTVSYTYTDRGLIDTYTDAHGASQSFGYNDAGLVTERQDSIAGQDIVTSYDYTPRYQQKSVSRGSNTTSFTYDAAGRMATTAYPNGVATSYGYDAAGRLTAQESVKDAQPLESYTQAYDPAGNLLTSTEASAGTTSYSYDDLNRLTNEDIAGYGANIYTYDAAGNRLTLTEPSPSGGPGLSISITRIYWATYQDWLDHELSINYRVTNQGPGTAYAAKVTNATATKGVYPVTDMPVSLGDINQGANAPVTLKYYIPSGVGSFQTTIYATCNNGSGTDYYYPAKRSFYSYNEANQLTSMTGPDGETTSYTYDQAGALTEKSSTADTTTMTYNGMDRLTQVATPADTVDYGYDALGRRITRSLGADTANKHLDAASDITVYETNASGALTAEMLTGADGLIAATDYSGSSPATAYYHYNPHGDASALTDADGSVTQSYRYDAFGNELSANDTAYGYTGKWQRDYDSATGLIRMGVREYD